VLYFDDFKRDAAATVNRVFSHIGVQSEFQGAYSEKKLVGHAPRSPMLNKVFNNTNPINKLAKRVVPTAIRSQASKWLQSANRGTIPKMSDTLRCELNAQFEVDLGELKKLTGSLPW